MKVGIPISSRQTLNTHGILIYTDHILGHKNISINFKELKSNSLYSLTTEE